MRRLLEVKHWKETTTRLNVTSFGRECHACGGTTQGWLIFCKCVCGNEHGICYECAGAADEIGMLESSVEEMTHDAESGGSVTTSYTASQLLQCVSKEEVRTALAIGRE